jgi:23S rRNA pseudouridine1911/1915/1917 synthase
MENNQDQIQRLVISESEEGMRIDRYLSEQYPDHTRSAIQKLIDQSQVRVNGKQISKNYKLKSNDQIDISFPEPVEMEVLPENIPLDILYEDDDLLVVNKPKGMVVHPAPGNYTGTLVNALLYHCGTSLSGINGIIRPGIVHRIDKNTSGLLMVAKNDIAHQSLAKQIQEHSFLREYQAVVYGRLKEDSGVIRFPIGRSKVDRKKMCVTTEHAREAVTHFEVIERYQNFTHVKFRLETGRTHQIRVHMAYLGHPVAGDDVYGPKKVITQLHGQCLHAKRIGFVHPKSEQWMEFDSLLPEYFQKFLAEIRK